MFPSIPLRAWLISIILIGFLVRVYNLAFESLDIDEADAYFLALADLPTLIGRFSAAGENGPLYFLLLRGWIQIAGGTEFALRYFSLIPSVLCIPLVYVLGRRLFGAGAGIIAALLFSGSSYLLFYAQMTKMYSLVVLLSLLSSYLLVRALESSRLLLWATYTLVTTLAMSVHIFAALLVPWHALLVLLTIRQRPRALAPWLVSLGLLTLPYLPLAIRRLAAVAAPETLNRQFTGPTDPLGMLAVMAREYGTLFDQAPATLIAAGFLGLTVLGLLAVAERSSQRKDWYPVLFVLLGIGVPLLAAYALVLLGLPLFSPRYLIITLPQFYLLWAAALGFLWVRARPLAAVIMAVFALLNGARWAQTAVGGERYREDWRAATAHVERRYQEGDVVLLLHDPAQNAFRYYQTVPLHLASLDGGAGRPPDPGRAPGEPASGRAWLVVAYFEAADTPPAERWLDGWSRPVTQDWASGIMINQYLTDQRPSRLIEPSDGAITFDGRLRLAGYQPMLPRQAEGGGPLQVLLDWRADQALRDDYHLVLTLEDQSGRVVASTAGDVGGQFYPSRTWPAGFSVRLLREISLPKGARAGEYRLTLTLSAHGESGAPRAEARYLLGTVRVGRE